MHGILDGHVVSSVKEPTISGDVVSSVRKPTNCGHCGQLREGTDQLSCEVHVKHIVFLDTDGITAKQCKLLRSGLASRMLLRTGQDPRGSICSPLSLQLFVELFEAFIAATFLQRLHLAGSLLLAYSVRANGEIPLAFSALFTIWTLACISKPQLL